MTSLAKPLTQITLKSLKLQVVGSTQKQEACPSNETSVEPNSDAGAAPKCRKIRVDSPQPSVQQLAKLGIKVRDFGYNNPLPPLRSVDLSEKQPQAPRIIFCQNPRRGGKCNPNARNREPAKALVRMPTEPELNPGTIVAPQSGGLTGIKRANAQFDLYNAQSCGPATALVRTPTESELDPGAILAPEPGGLTGIKRANAQFSLLGSESQ